MHALLRARIQGCVHRRSFAAFAPTGQRAARASPATGVSQTPRSGSTGMSTGSLLFFGFPVAVTFSLGVWQVRRLKRKLRLIDERERRLAAQPLEATDLFQTETDFDHRRVQVSGRFLHGLEMLVGPRSAPKDLPTPVLQWGGSSGLQVITPFQLDGGEVILVNRGWVPQRLSNRLKRSSAAVSPLAFLTRITESTTLENYGDGDSEASRSERKTFTAIVRGCDEKNRFTPDNKPETGEWFYVDAAAMTRAAGLEGPDGKAVVVELLEPLPKSGWPHPRSYEEFLQFRTPPSTHVTYATTWFCLSAALALLTRHRMRQPVRGRT